MALVVRCNTVLWEFLNSYNQSYTLERGSNAEGYVSVWINHKHWSEFGCVWQCRSFLCRLPLCVLVTFMCVGCPNRAVQWSRHVVAPALVDLNGRQFGGRTIDVIFFSEARFNEDDISPEKDEFTWLQGELMYLNSCNYKMQTTRLATSFNASETRWRRTCFRWIGCSALRDGLSGQKRRSNTCPSVWDT